MGGKAERPLGLAPSGGQGRGWPLASAAFAEVARDIGRQVCERAVVARDDSVFWRGPVLRSSGVEPAPLGPHLFPGTMGVALFLAALEARCGGGGFSTFCRRGLAPLRRELAKIMEDPARTQNVRHGIGGLSGLGSLVYGLVRIGDLLGEPELYGDAGSLTSLLTCERIAEDASLDVMLGSAGAILALLALDERRPEPNELGCFPVELAAACGRNLLRKRASQWRGGHLRAAEEETPAVGFCHGAAGMSHALLRLFARTGQVEFKEAALDGLASVRSHWSAQRHAPASWCKGTAGIAIGRSAVLNVAESPRAREEVWAAADAMRSAAVSGLDDICCGNMGRVDALLYVSKKLGEAAFSEAAEALAGEVLQRRKRSGGFALSPRLDGFFDVRFFPGLSGIGYAFLRLATGGGIPCVLAME